MEENTILLMQKNGETGLLEKEVGSYTIQENSELVESVYLVNKDGKDIIYLNITTEREVGDSEFDLVYDNYEMEALKEYVLSIEEVDDTYNPTWQVTFEFINHQEEFQKRILQVLNKHKEILEKSYQKIKDGQESK